VGRFNTVKNHPFIVGVAGEFSSLRDNVRFVLVGDGVERANVEALVAETGLHERFIFTGSRSDVPRLLSSMDLFMLPSHHEGLGLVLVEAQAAGLPCRVSDSAPRDTDIVPGMCRWMPLSAGPRAWASALVQLHEENRLSPEQARSTVEQSPFNITESVRRLASIYEEGTADQSNHGE
jgi:glycosyltransferase involved in cell wall biosynthesis